MGQPLERYRAIRATIATLDEKQDACLDSGQVDAGTLLRDLTIAEDWASRGAPILFCRCGSQRSLGSKENRYFS